MNNTKLQLLRNAMTSYAPLSDETWEMLVPCYQVRHIEKGENLVHTGKPSHHFYFVLTGLIRSFTVSENGKEYSKRFFPENTFPGSISSLLTGTPSDFTLQALENSSVISIDHAGYRKALKSQADLMLFHIQYLEKNWVLDKEPIEVGLALSDSTARYLRFLQKNKPIIDRIPLLYVASAIGVTPTQLSRIRKSFSSDLPTSKQP